MRALRALLPALLAVAGLATPAHAQATAFTYQGRLTDGALPASGIYDLRVEVFATPAGGTPLAAAVLLGDVAIQAGVFTASLDFGSVFDGGPRWLEVAVRPGTSSGPYVVLAPRQPVTPAPYAMRSARAAQSDDALQLGGLAPDQYVTVASAPGSFIQNTTTLQAGSSFNIDGDGTAGGRLAATVVDAAAEYALGGARVLAAPGTRNTFAGLGAGIVNAKGERNAFFGSEAGLANTTGTSNTYVGDWAGRSNETSNENTFVGSAAGHRSTGGGNTFLGSLSGTGFGVSPGSGNTFLGYYTGFGIATGSDNTLVGSHAALGGGDLSNATAIGAFAQATRSNTVVLGSVAGVNGATTTARVAVGTTDPGSGARMVVTADAAAPTALSVFNDSPANGSPSFLAANFNSNGYAARFEGDMFVNGRIVLLRTGTAGATSLCLNAGAQLATCSSSLRYKTDVRPLAAGLDLVGRLRPITFRWKADGAFDLGLAAEEVAEQEPLLVTHNDRGEIEGVKYPQLSVVLVNAIQEQQARLDEQERRLKELTETVERLRRLLGSE
jgi:hypothetical protein